MPILIKKDVLKSWCYPQFSSSSIQKVFASEELSGCGFSPRNLAPLVKRKLQSELKSERELKQTLMAKLGTSVLCEEIQPTFIVY